MSQEYSDPKRASDPYSLPDVELWQDTITEINCPHCGVFSLPHDSAHAVAEVTCPSCERLIWTEDNGDDSDPRTDTTETAWWFWFCLPGCMPDSDVYGPYTTREEAIEAIRDYAPDDDDNE